ncbi:MAG: hypothetical protein WED11_04520, partial [Natronospirillum sp.]
LTAKAAQGDLRGLLDERTRSRQLADTQRQEVRQEQVTLEARRLGIHELKDKADLEQRQTNASTALQQQTQALLNADKTRMVIRQALDTLAKHWPDAEATLIEEHPQQGLKNPLSGVVETQEALDQLGDELARLLNRDWVDLDAMESSVQQTLTLEGRVNLSVRHWQETGRYVPDLSLRDWLSRVLDRRQQKRLQIQRQISQHQQDIQGLAQAKVTYPTFVRNALQAIAEALPEAQPQVLCDHVTVTDPEWQNVIEAYLGMARFGIMVEPEFEAEAARLVRGLPGTDARARVIQGARAQEDAARLTPKSNSLVRVLAFTHASAEAYLKASFGNVER